MFYHVAEHPGSRGSVVNFTINPELLSFYDKDMKWMVEPGDFTTMTRTASDETQSVKLKVTK